MASNMSDKNHIMLQSAHRIALSHLTLRSRFKPGCSWTYFAGRLERKRRIGPTRTETSQMRILQRLEPKQLMLLPVP